LAASRAIFGILDINLPQPTLAGHIFAQLWQLVVQQWQSYVFVSTFSCFLPTTVSWRTTSDSTGVATPATLGSSAAWKSQAPFAKGDSGRYAVFGDVVELVQVGDCDCHRISRSL